MPREIVGRGWAFPPTIGVQGGLALTHEQSEITQAIIIILTTSIGERVMRPTFGSLLPELMFEPVTGQTLSLAVRYVEEALGMWEPRIEVTEVTAVVDEARHGRILIDIQYNIKHTNDKRSLVFPFYTIPEHE
jgi:uncharacterized protein